MAFAAWNKPRVAVVRAAGTIKALAQGSQHVNMQKLSKPLQKAFKMRNVKAVALVVNSPGGSAVQSNLIKKRVQALRKETGVPVYAFVEDAAASGGYFVACGADEIYADESSVIGSIGVISAQFGLDKWIQRYDIEYREQTAGTEKSLANPFKPQSKQDNQRLQELLDGIHDNFKTVVKDSRGDRLALDADGLMEGRVWLAAEAQKLGLIDGIGDMRTVMMDKLGEEPRFIELNKGSWASWFGEVSSWYSQMSTGATAGAGGAAGVSADAVSGALAAVHDDHMWKGVGVAH